jgi:hypothetical protein
MGAGYGTGTSALAVGAAVVAGAAVSATGIGLVAASAVLTLASSGLAGRSMVSSTRIVLALKELRKLVKNGEFALCMPLIGASPDAATFHGLIGDKVLSYVISQKTEKAVKKGIEVVPLAGLLTKAYAVGRYALKKNRGKLRSYYANVLGEHLITCECPLARVITAVLYSVKEMQAMEQMNLDKVGPLLGDKMKSK